MTDTFDTSTVKIGWWFAPCCIHDLHKLLTAQDLQDAIEWYENDGEEWRFGDFYPSLAVAVAALGKQGYDKFEQGIIYGLSSGSGESAGDWTAAAKPVSETDTPPAHDSATPVTKPE